MSLLASPMKKALMSRQTNYPPSRNVSTKSLNTEVHTLPAIFTHTTSPYIRLINYAEMANSTRMTVVYPKDRLFWLLSSARRTSCWRCSKRQCRMMRMRKRRRNRRRRRTGVRVVVQTCPDGVCIVHYSLFTTLFTTHDALTLCYAVQSVHYLFYS
jgi:hypothetical protein